MAAMYCGAKVFDNFRSILWKISIASVGSPVEVRMGGACILARA